MGIPVAVSSYKNIDSSMYLEMFTFEFSFVLSYLCT